ncbi:hypothetical protein FB451DRAFT_1391633 [Mycena latifolia]|nr:hypothetical protein FB451DRAFT_1391633 [Mycena latifolia]
MPSNPSLLRPRALQTSVVVCGTAPTLVRPRNSSPGVPPHFTLRNPPAPSARFCTLTRSGYSTGARCRQGGAGIRDDCKFCADISGLEDLFSTFLLFHSLVLQLKAPAAPPPLRRPSFHAFTPSLLVLACLFFYDCFRPRKTRMSNQVYILLFASGVHLLFLEPFKGQGIPTESTNPIRPSPYVPSDARKSANSLHLG